MAGLQRTLRGLSKGRDHWAKLIEAATPQISDSDSVPSRLREVTGFGSNPGNLRMLTYVPEGLSQSRPLVVVLHGCTQTASGYDHGAGWSTLADRYGFALLFPEQRQANNAKLCFNWFQPGDTRRDGGEPLSIRQMVDRMARDHGIDRGRIFVTGLSAGGAMTSVMLATYPEVFAGGAIIAGLPYGTAASVQDAFGSMFQGRTRPAREWGDLVRGASPHRGPWPKLSVWHGTADTTVTSSNAGEIIKQWADVHGLPARPSAESTVDGYPRQVWRDAEGRDVIESYTITSMAHGTPLATGDGADDYGAAGPFLLDVGISSTYHIAKFWGLTGDSVRTAVSVDREMVWARGAVAFSGAEPKPLNAEARAGYPEHAEEHGRGASAAVIDIQSVIDKALRAAGLKS